MFHLKQPIVLWLAYYFLANVSVKESIEDRVRKMEGNLQELSVKVDLFGKVLGSIVKLLNISKSDQRLTRQRMVSQGRRI